MTWVFGDGVDICECLRHASIFDFLDLVEVGSVAGSALFYPVNQRDDDLEGLRATGVDPGGDKPFNQLVHPVPNNAIEAVWFELSLRACKEVAPTQRALALAQFSNHCMDARSQHFVIIEEICGHFADSAEVVSFIKTGECAVRLGGSPAFVGLCTKRWETGLKSEGIEHPVEIQAVQNLAANLHAVLEDAALYLNITDGNRLNRCLFGFHLELLSGIAHRTQAGLNDGVLGKCLPNVAIPGISIATNRHTEVEAKNI